MALATTCPQCKTSFKVIPDQLKLRRGLVRCGVCQHVFSGIDYLRYVDDSGKTRQKAGTAAGAALAGAGTEGPDAPAPSAGSAVGREAGSPARDMRPVPGGGAPDHRSPGSRQAELGAASPASAQTVIDPDDEL